MVAESYGEIDKLSRLYCLVKLHLQVGGVIFSTIICMPESVHITIKEHSQVLKQTLIAGIVRGIAPELVCTGNKVFCPQFLWCPHRHKRGEHKASCDIPNHVVLHFLIR